MKVTSFILLILLLLPWQIEIRWAGKREHWKLGSSLLLAQQQSYQTEVKEKAQKRKKTQKKSSQAPARAISYNISFGKKQTVKCHKIVNWQTGKEISPTDTLLSGKKWDLKLLFKKYQTVVVKDLLLPAGKGAFVIELPKAKLQPLKRHQFVYPQEEIQLHGITYPLVIYADSQRVEEHHIESRKAFKRCYYIAWLPPETQKLRIYSGYLYSEFQEGNFPLELGKLEKIDGEKFIAHLQKLAGKSKPNYNKLLEILEKMVKDFSPRKKLRTLSAPEMTKLLSYVEGWEIVGAKKQLRHRFVLDTLKQLK